MGFRLKLKMRAIQFLRQIGSPRIVAFTSQPMMLPGVLLLPSDKRST